jgi:hypothetical protein
VHDVLIALAIFGATVASAGTFGLYMLVRTVWRANRVLPERRTEAPISWLVSPREPARLHRRLRRAVQLANGSVGPLRDGSKRGRKPQKGLVSPLVEVADELVAQALHLDDRLPQAATAHPHWKGRALGELAGEVNDVEAAAFRLSRLAVTWQMEMRQAAELSPASVAPLELRARLDAIEAALAELSPAAIQAHAGAQTRAQRLARPDATLTRGH